MQTMDDLMKRVPQVGRLEWIGLSPHRSADIVTCESVEVRAETGLVGDHHAQGGNSHREVTFIQQEHLAVVGALMGRPPIDPAQARRNLVVKGINLLAFKKSRFRVGDVVFEGTGPCDPCSRMQETIGDGGYHAMRGHGGITAKVVRAGAITVGDEVHPVFE